MLLAIDVGNTQTVVGIYQDGSLQYRWRVATNKSHTSDELRVKLVPLLASEGIALKDICGVSLASVVPALTLAWRAAAHRMIGEEAVVCSAETAGTLFEADYPNPHEIGADRVADAVAAKALYGAPVIVVDFGTATNMEVIDADGRFIGGVIAPIGIYLVFNAANPETAQGWGVPTATDIAFALGILALLGNRVPSGVRVFLSTLAVADDIIAILVIAIFYGHSPSIFWLGAAAVVLVVLVLMNRNHIYSLIPYLLVGAVLWYCVFMSGVHSTIAGVLLAFVIPSGSRVNLKGFITWSGNKVRQARDAFEPETPVIAQGAYIETVQDLSRVARQVVPPATRLEHRLYPWVYFGILPLFALTNADVSFTGMDIGAMLTDPVLYGVMLGLLLGKPLGIMLMSFAIVKSKLASLPENVNWFHMLGASILGGVGFTMAIFVANLAFTDEMHIATAKLAILAASLLAGVLGFVFLMLQAKAAQKRGVAYLSMQTDDENLQTADRDAVHDSEQMLRDIDDAEIEDFKLVKKHSGVFEIAVDLGPTGLLGGGSIGDVREAIRDEVVRVLRDEGEDELLEKVQREFEDHEGEPPLISVEEALRRSGEKERLRDALRREGQDAIGMAGGSGEDKR